MLTLEKITPATPGLAAAVAALRAAKHAVALTGAGISVESGIPDFRSPGGLWEIFSPEEYATYSVFEAEPAKAWELYRAIEAKVRPAEPNPAHYALARLEELGLLKAIVTQNIDGLHQAAGSKQVYEIHGDHQHLHCVACDTTRPTRPGDFGVLDAPDIPDTQDTPEARERRGQPRPRPTPDSHPVPDSRPEPDSHLTPDSHPAPDSPPLYPRCDDCGHALKPNVVLFGEAVRDLPAIAAELEPCDLLIVVGTSAQVAPSSNFPHAVKHRGGQVMEFNSEPTLLSGGGQGQEQSRGGLRWLLAGMAAAEPVTDYLFLGKAGETLPRFVEVVEGKT